MKKVFLFLFTALFSVGTWAQALSVVDVGNTILDKKILRLRNKSLRTMLYSHLKKAPRQRCYAVLAMTLIQHVWGQ